MDTLTLEDFFLIATGGDDQHIRVGMYTLQGELIASIRKFAHASCIKGICIYQKEG